MNDRNLERQFAAGCFVGGFSITLNNLLTFIADWLCATN